MIFSLIASAIVEYEHPVLESLLREQSFSFWLMTFAVTAIATPVFEEFLFRGLLQGSLQALADSDPSTETWKPAALWPLLLTSGLFAVMHLGQGARQFRSSFFPWVWVSCTGRPGRSFPPSSFT